MKPQCKLGRHFSIDLGPFPQTVHIFSLSNTTAQHLLVTSERDPTDLQSSISQLKESSREPNPLWLSSISGSFVSEAVRALFQLATNPSFVPTKKKN